MNTYYIVDANYGLGIVAGDNYDGKLYRQIPADRGNAKWELVPTEAKGYYLIRDIGHGKCIVAGDNYDGKLYHQDSGNRQNAEWRLVELPDSDGKGSATFNLIDRKHNKAIVSGVEEDGNLYHQDLGDKPNVPYARWALIPNELKQA